MALVFPSKSSQVLATTVVKDLKVIFGRRLFPGDFLERMGKNGNIFEQSVMISLSSSRGRTISLPKISEEAEQRYPPKIKG